MASEKSLKTENVGAKVAANVKGDEEEKEKEKANPKVMLEADGETAVAVSAQEGETLSDPNCPPIFDRKEEEGEEEEEVVGEEKLLDKMTVDLSDRETKLGQLVADDVSSESQSTCTVVAHSQSHGHSCSFDDLHSAGKDSKPIGAQLSVLAIDNLPLGNINCHRQRSASDEFAPNTSDVDNGNDNGNGNEEDHLVEICLSSGTETPDLETIDRLGRQFAHSSSEMFATYHSQNFNLYDHQHPEHQRKQHNHSPITDDRYRNQLSQNHHHHHLQQQQRRQQRHVRGFSESEPKITFASRRVREYFESFKSHGGETIRLYQFFKSTRTELVACFLFAIITSQALIVCRNQLMSSDEKLPASLGFAFKSSYEAQQQQQQYRQQYPVTRAQSRMSLHLISGLVSSFTVASLTQVFGHISGCHLIPSVSLALCIKGHISRARLASYLVVQSIGSALGILLLSLLTSSQLTADEYRNELVRTATASTSGLELREIDSTNASMAQTAAARSLVLVAAEHATRARRQVEDPLGLAGSDANINLNDTQGSETILLSIMEQHKQRRSQRLEAANLDGASKRDQAERTEHKSKEQKEVFGGLLGAKVEESKWRSEPVLSGQPKTIIDSKPSTYQVATTEAESARVTLEPLQATSVTEASKMPQLLLSLKATEDQGSGANGISNPSSANLSEANEGRAEGNLVDESRVVSGHANGITSTARSQPVEAIFWSSTEASLPGLTGQNSKQNLGQALSGLVRRQSLGADDEKLSHLQSTTDRPPLKLRRRKRNRGQQQQQQQPAANQTNLRLGPLAGSGNSNGNGIEASNSSRLYVNLLEFALPDSIMSSESIYQCICEQKHKLSRPQPQTQDASGHAQALPAPTIVQLAASSFDQCLSLSNSSQMFVFQLLATLVIVLTYLVNVDPRRVDLGFKSLSIGLAYFVASALTVQSGGFFGNPMQLLFLTWLSPTGEWRSEWLIYLITPFIGGLFGAISHEYIDFTSLRNRDKQLHLRRSFYSLDNLQPSNGGHNYNNDNNNDHRAQAHTRARQVAEFRPVLQLEASNSNSSSNNNDNNGLAYTSAPTARDANRARTRPSRRMSSSRSSPESAAGSSGELTLSQSAAADCLEPAAQRPPTAASRKLAAPTSSGNININSHSQSHSHSSSNGRLAFERAVANHQAHVSPSLIPTAGLANRLSHSHTNCDHQMRFQATPMVGFRRSDFDANFLISSPSSPTAIATPRQFANPAIGST